MSRAIEWRIFNLPCLPSLPSPSKSEIIPALWIFSFLIFPSFPPEGDSTRLVYRPKRSSPLSSGIASTSSTSLCFPYFCSGRAWGIFSFIFIRVSPVTNEELADKIRCDCNVDIKGLTMFCYLEGPFWKRVFSFSLLLLPNERLLGRFDNRRNEIGRYSYNKAVPAAAV